VWSSGSVDARFGISIDDDDGVDDEVLVVLVLDGGEEMTILKRLIDFGIGVDSDDEDSIVGLEKAEVQ